MSKINITNNDYTYHGIGYNDFNFINNVVPRISQWLVEEFSATQNSDLEHQKEFANKLNQIGRIIDNPPMSSKEKVEVVERVINDRLYWAGCDICELENKINNHICERCTVPQWNGYLLSDKAAHDAAEKIVKALAYYSGETEEFYE